MEECYDDGGFFFAHEEIVIEGAIHVLMDVLKTTWMCVSEVRSIVLQNENQGFKNYVQTWPVYG